MTFDIDQYFMPLIGTHPFLPDPLALATIPVTEDSATGTESEYHNHYDRTTNSLRRSCLPMVIPHRHANPTIWKYIHVGDDWVSILSW